jgi:Uma2 family endonuclease
MSTVPIPSRRYTLEEYYDREPLAEVRHEFHDGEILAMSGGSMEHSQIAINLGSELRTRLKGKPCQAFESNLRSRIEASNRNVYPDLAIVCGPVELDTRDKSRGTIMNPRVVFEILSPSTERYDRTEKRDHYLLVPTLEAHVLIEQDRPRVEVLSRAGDGRWEVNFANGLDAVLKLGTLDLEIPLREIYDRVTFPPRGPAIPPREDPFADPV